MPAGLFNTGLLGGADGDGGIAPETGWPDPTDVYRKLQYTAPGGIAPAVTDDLQNLIAAIVAEFEGPPIFGGGGRGGRGGVMSMGSDMIGGTGRSFTGTLETRLFDGNGYPELRVDDIVPGTLPVVHVYDALLVDVMLADPVKPYVGHNRIIRPQGAGSLLGASYATPGIFPIGLQNIAVYATWGYSAVPPRDVWEAVCCEAAFRAISQGVVPLTGVGEDVRIGNFSINTSVGVMVWGKSSPLAMYHNNYLSAIERYRERGAWRKGLAVKRMS